jgi:hypothetical protein
LGGDSLQLDARLAASGVTCREEATARLAPLADSEHRAYTAAA